MQWVLIDTFEINQKQFYLWHRKNRDGLDALTITRENVRPTITCGHYIEFRGLLETFPHHSETINLLRARNPEIA